MIDDCLFESVAVSIGEENRNGDENPVEVAVRQGFFQSIEKENIRNDTENLSPCQWDSYALPLSFRNDNDFLFEMKSYRFIIV